MAEERDLGAGLIACRSADELAIVLPDGAPGLLLARVNGLVRVRLVLARGNIGADVTFQPGVVDRQLDQSAREQGVDPNRWRLAMLSELREWSAELDWCPQQPGLLTAAVGALGHPLLAQVYARGHAALGELPRWSLPVLRSQDPAAAATTLDPRPTRRLTRALAGSLIARPVPAAVELAPLSFALAGAGLVNVDELANLLEVPQNGEPARLPLGEDIREVRRVLEHWPPSRRSALLLDSACRADLVRLAATLRQLWWEWDRMPLPLPVRWEDLTEARVRLVPVVTPSVAGEAREPVPRRPAPPRPTQPQRRPAPAPHAPEVLPAPVVDRRLPVVCDAPPQPLARPVAPFEQPRRAPAVATVDRINIPTRWPIPARLSAVHHACRDDLRFVVPTSAPELRHWGRMLQNCLGDFVPAVATGRSWIVGIERNEILIGCAEIEPGSRHLRQLLGSRNRPLPPNVVAAATAVFGGAGVARV